MILFRKQKKGVSLYAEIALYAITFIIIGLIFLLTNSVEVTSIEYETMTPEISYQYPSLFVKTFLMLEISDKDKEELNLSLDNIYYVKDIIKFESTKSKEIITEIKNDYIKDQDKSLTFFNNYIQIEFLTNDLLYFSYDQTDIPNIESMIAKKIFFTLKEIVEI